jgi:hypothetical protein
MHGEMKVIVKAEPPLLPHVILAPLPLSCPKKKKKKNRKREREKTENQRYNRRLRRKEIE